MKSRWLVGVCVLALLAASSGAALGQGRGQGRDRAQNRGQAKKAEREAQSQGPQQPGQRAARSEFDDHDRALTQNWVEHNRASLPPGLRKRDRLPPGIERQIERGWIVEPSLRAQLHPAPEQLVRVFAPPPPGSRYMTFGGHVVMVDAAFRIADVIRVNLGIAR